MWVWISIGVGLLVALVIFAGAALRAWRQVKALRAAVDAVQAELTSYVDRMQVAAPGGPGQRERPARWQDHDPDVH